MADNFEEVNALKITNANLRADLEAAIKTRDSVTAELSKATAMLDRIVVRGMMEGETEVECLQRQLEDAKNENARLHSCLVFEASRNEELSRYRKMESMQRDFIEAKESLQGIVETISQYIKAASDD